MTDVSGIHDGDLRFDHDGTVSGIVSGRVLVATGCRVCISGMVRGDVVAEPGAEVTITGIVSGALHADGATVHVTGIVSIA